MIGEGNSGRKEVTWGEDRLEVIYLELDFAWLPLVPNSIPHVTCFQENNHHSA